MRKSYLAGERGGERGGGGGSSDGKRVVAASLRFQSLYCGERLLTAVVSPSAVLTTTAVKTCQNRARRAPSYVRLLVLLRCRGWGFTVVFCSSCVSAELNFATRNERLVFLFSLAFIKIKVLFFLLLFVGVAGHGQHLTGLGHVQDLARAMANVLGKEVAKGQVYNVQVRPPEEIFV